MVKEWGEKVAQVLRLVFLVGEQLCCILALLWALLSAFYFLKPRRNEGKISRINLPFFFFFCAVLIHAELLFCWYPSPWMERFKYVSLGASLPARHRTRLTNFCGASLSQPHTGCGSLEPAAINKFLQRTFVTLHLIYVSSQSRFFFSSFPSSALLLFTCHLYFPVAFNKQVAF